MPPSQLTRYRWVWYFVVLAILTAGGITANIWYNERQQLTPAQLESARRLWTEKGPPNYQLKYTIKSGISSDPTGVFEQIYYVQVRDGKAISVTDADGRVVKAPEYPLGSMDSLFDDIAQQLRSDAESGKPRAFVTATFDGSDGHLTHYVHSVMQTRERLELSVELIREKD